MTPLQILTQRVHPAMRYLIEPDAALDDLGLALVDLWGVACDIEEALGFEFEGEPARSWETVGDVLAAAERATVAA